MLEWRSYVLPGEDRAIHGDGDSPHEFSGRVSKGRRAHTLADADVYGPLLACCDVHGEVCVCVCVCCRYGVVAGGGGGGGGGGERSNDIELKVRVPPRLSAWLELTHDIAGLGSWRRKAAPVDCEGDC